MDNMLKGLFEVLILPKTIIENIPGLPKYMQYALIESIYFVFILIFLYLFIEIIEQFFVRHSGLLIKILRKMGVVAAILFSLIPECGYAVIVSVYYSRKMITKGVLLAFFICCSDDALPILFLNPAKTDVLVPLIIIKTIIALLVWAAVDFAIIFQKKPVEEPNAVNIDLNEDGCCHHKISSIGESTGIMHHTFTHTFHMFLYVLFALILYYSAANSAGGVDSIKTMLFNNALGVQAVGCAIFGLIPHCAASVFLAVAYAKGLIAFSGLLAGLITTTGVALINLAKVNKQRNVADTFFITMILLMVGAFVGVFASGMPAPSVPLFAVQ